MSIRYMKEGNPVVCRIMTMQQVALDADLWDAYLSCGEKGREIFKACLAEEDTDWGLDTVLVWADSVDEPDGGGNQPVLQPVVAKPTAPPTSKTPVTMVPAKTTAEENNCTDFQKWMFLVNDLVGKDKTLSFSYGKRRVLKGDGTVAVKVSVLRNDRPINGVSFVFHYHRGSKGAQVGSTAGSKWHFKPYDSAQKHVRVEDSQFCKLDAGMVKQVKTIAKGK